MTGEAEAFFRYACPGCGADIDAADRPFLIGASALVADTDFELLDVTCLTCGLQNDVAAWLISAAEYLASPGDEGLVEAAALGRALDPADFAANTVIGKFLLTDLARAVERLAPRVTVSYHQGRFLLAERSSGPAS